MIRSWGVGSDDIPTIERPRPLNQEQFGEQLAMFERPSDMVEKVYKGDSLLWSVGGRRPTPREEWETPVLFGSGEHGRTTSLREYKLDQLQNDAKYKDIDSSKMPPIPIEHEPPTGRKRMADGHHRLAYAEAKKMPWVPVTHRRGW